MEDETMIPRWAGSKPGSFIAMVFFYVVSIMHLVRLLFQVEVIVGGMIIPLWLSGIGFIASAILGSVIQREIHREKSAN